MMGKYIKPKSLTWLVSFISLVSGLVIATEALHGQTAVAASLNALWGHPDPSLLIQTGLLGIGIRGAIK